jgi:hypothetical protein
MAVPFALGCQPATPPPFAPPRDASFDADLDAPRPDAPRPDAPRPDAPRPDAATSDAPEAEADAGSSDGGSALAITVDGLLLEPEWSEATLASSASMGVGAFSGCSLSALRALADDANVYLAVELRLCRGAVVAYVDTGSPGVLLGMTELGDLDGTVDAVLSRSWSLVDPSRSPRFAWGSAEGAAFPSSASDTIGWRELSQDGPHRHFTVDLSACGGDACETRVPRSALGLPGRLRIAVRLATPDVGSLLALPMEAEADVTLTQYATFTLP